MTISTEVLDELLHGVKNADDSLGDQGLMKELKVRLMERMLRVSDLLCMSNMAHASLTKEHDNDDDFQGRFRRAAERR